jgi:hypothetical protein
MNGNHWKIERDDYYGQLHYKGIIQVAEPMAFIIKVYDQDGFNYLKVPENDSLAYEFDCYFIRVPSNGIQVIVKVDNSENSMTIWRNKTFEVHENGTFMEGEAFTPVHFENGQPAVDILGISSEKLLPVGNGIWKVNEKYIESVTEQNREILSKYRHGFVRIP